VDGGDIVSRGGGEGGSIVGGWIGSTSCGGGIVVIGGSKLFN